MLAPSEIRPQSIARAGLFASYSRFGPWHSRFIMATRSKTPDPAQSLLTLPNLLTSVRLILLPPFCFALITAARPADSTPAWVPLALFALMAVSDMFDGLAARRLQLVSRFGALLDAVADKLTLLIALVLLTTHGVRSAEGDPLTLPSWVLGAALAKDVFVCIGYLVLRQRADDRRVEPDRFGKWCTAIQMILILTLLLWYLHPPVFGQMVTILSWASAALALAAMASYGVRGWRRLQTGIARQQQERDT